MKTIALVDFSFQLRVQYHARSNDSGPNECAQHTLNQLSDWRRRFDHVIVCLDSPPYHRNKLYPEYKAQRDKSDQAYPQIVRWAKERLVADGYSIAASPGYEADDVMATLANKLFLRDGDTKIVLITADKDASQCISPVPVSGIPRIEVWAPKLGGDFEVRTAQWVHDKWGIVPTQVPLLLAICGDKGDNIPGIAGIGEKGAAKLITSFGTIDKMRAEALKLFEASKEEDAKPLPAFWTKFLAGHTDLPKWLQLTTLNVGVDLDVDALLQKREMKPLVEDGMKYDPEDDGRPSEPDWDDIEEQVQEQKQEAEEPPVPKGSSADRRAQGPETGSVTTANFGVTEHHRIQDGGKTADPKASAPPVVRAPTVRSEPVSNGGGQRSEPEYDPGSAIVTTGEPVTPHWNLALQPRTANEAMMIAKTLFNSRLYGQYGSERGVYAVISLGRELGLGMAAALAGFHIVQDKPFASANLLRSLAETDPNCEYFVCIESDDTKATWETKHRKFPTPMRYTYTRERAQQAGMFTGANKHNWNTKTQEMLEKTAGAKASRRWYPSRTLGLHCTEELGDE